jgi:hypothetical protein
MTRKHLTDADRATAALERAGLVERMMGDDGVLRSRPVPVAPEELEKRLAKAERFERGQSK